MSKAKSIPKPKQLVTIIFNDGYPVDLLLRSKDSKSSIEAMLSKFMLNETKFNKLSIKHKGIKSFSYKFFQYEVITKDIYYKVPIFIDESFYFRDIDYIYHTAIIDKLQRYCKHNIVLSGGAS